MRRYVCLQVLARRKLVNMAEGPCYIRRVKGSGSHSPRDGQHRGRFSRPSIHLGTGQRGIDYVAFPQYLRATGLGSSFQYGSSSQTHNWEIESCNINPNPVQFLMQARRSQDTRLIAKNSAKCLDGGSPPAQKLNFSGHDIRIANSDERLRHVSQISSLIPQK